MSEKIDGNTIKARNKNLQRLKYRISASLIQGVQVDPGCQYFATKVSQYSSLFEIWFRTEGKYALAYVSSVVMAVIDDAQVDQLKGESSIGKHFQQADRRIYRETKGSRRPHPRILGVCNGSAASSPGA
jgi:hypothetical protein